MDVDMMELEAGKYLIKCFTIVKKSTRYFTVLKWFNIIWALKQMNSFRFKVQAKLKMINFESRSAQITLRPVFSNQIPSDPFFYHYQ